MRSSAPIGITLGQDGRGLCGVTCVPAPSLRLPRAEPGQACRHEVHACACMLRGYVWRASSAGLEGAIHARRQPGGAMRSSGALAAPRRRRGSGWRARWRRRRGPARRWGSAARPRCTPCAGRSTPARRAPRDAATPSEFPGCKGSTSCACMARACRLAFGSLVNLTDKDASRLSASCQYPARPACRPAPAYACGRSFGAHRPRSTTAMLHFTLNAAPAGGACGRGPGALLLPVGGVRGRLCRSRGRRRARAARARLRAQLAAAGAALGPCACPT